MPKENPFSIESIPQTECGPSGAGTFTFDPEQKNPDVPIHFPVDASATSKIGFGYEETAEKLADESKKSRTDTLTGIYNRLGFFETVRQLINEDGSSYTVFYFDLDEFKSINDDLGHEAGDKALLAYTAAIKRAFSSFFGGPTVIARFGGDEFVAYVSGEVEDEDIRTITDALKSELQTEAHAFSQSYLADREYGTVFTASIGVAHNISRSCDIDSAMRFADELSKTAKKDPESDIRGNHFVTGTIDSEGTKKFNERILFDSDAQSRKKRGEVAKLENVRLEAEAVLQEYGLLQKSFDELESSREVIKGRFFELIEFLRLYADIVAQMVKWRNGIPHEELVRFAQLTMATRFFLDTESEQNFFRTRLSGFDRRMRPSKTSAEDERRSDERRKEE